MTNHECGKGMACYEVAREAYFEDYGEKCQGKQGGCFCKKPEKNKRCQFDPSVKMLQKALNDAIGALKAIEAPTGEQE